MSYGRILSKKSVLTRQNRFTIIFLTILIVALVFSIGLIKKETRIQSAASGGLTRPIKYYGIDRARPFSDNAFTNFTNHHWSTVIIDLPVDSASSGEWNKLKTFSDKYHFNYVIWPNQGRDIARCGWENPFDNPQDGNYIGRVTGMLDALSQDPHFIGIVTAHEPMWNVEKGCHSTIADMTTIKTQLKNYLANKNRGDVKIWVYIDNVSDMKNMSGFVPADIEKTMDVAVIWQHCFGTEEGTCTGALNRINTDRQIIQQAGGEGKVDLVFLFQTFAMGSGYRMPSLAEMQEWDTKFIETGALDGFMYYTWGAGPNYNWYDDDLETSPELLPETDRIFNTYINPEVITPTTAPTPIPSPSASVAPTITPSPTVSNAPVPQSTLIPVPSPGNNRDTNGPTLTSSIVKMRKYSWVKVEGSDPSGIKEIKILLGRTVVARCWSESCTYFAGSRKLPYTVTVYAWDNSTSQNVTIKTVTVK